MSRINLLTGATTNARGAAVAADYDGTYQKERRIWVDGSSSMGGATVSIEVRPAGDTAWKATGISFTAATDVPQLLDIQQGDEICANVTGGTGANITVGMC